MIYLPSPGMFNTYAMVEFMGLELAEVLHLFSLGNQNVPLFGGQILTERSTAKDVAANIIALLAKVLDDVERVQKISTRKVLFEKRQRPLIPNNY